MAAKTVVYDTIEKFSPIQWNDLHSDQNPFISFEFYRALEKGKCLKGQSGWHPLYFAVFENDQLSSALVAYVKTDSYGEFIFDWEWARAYQQYGLPYYPKLTVAIPYSPISAPKILGDPVTAKGHLLPALWNFYQKESVSGLHVLFTNKEESLALNNLGLEERHSFQYHWLRNEAESFDDYLQSLRKGRRKSIKRERREIANNLELSFEVNQGENISKEKIEFFYQCYLTTIDKKWSQAYLSLDFFMSFLKDKGDSIYLVIAKESDQPVACSLYLKSNDTLYGRYWGSVKDIPFLHFELCIYKGIELTIELGLKTFEAGAQGEHKRMRGFTPVITHSYHHLKEPQFFKAVCDFLMREKEGISQWFKEFSKQSSLKADREERN